MVLQDRLDRLFETTDTATTEQVCEALYIQRQNTRTIKGKIARFGLNLEYVGKDRWTR